MRNKTDFRLEAAYHTTAPDLHSQGPSYVKLKYKILSAIIRDTALHTVPGFRMFFELSEA